MRLPSQRKIDSACYQGLRRQPRRLIALNDRLDDLRGKKGEPYQPANVVFGKAFALPDLCHGVDPAGDQIVEPTTRPSDGFQERRICLLRLLLFAV